MVRLRPTPIALAFLFTLTILAGCLGGDQQPDEDDSTDVVVRDALGRLVTQLHSHHFANHTFEANLTSGGVSRIHQTSGPAMPFTVRLPEGHFTLADGRWGPTELEVTGSVDFLVPPGVLNLSVTITMGSHEAEFDLPVEREPGALLLSGERVLDLYELHRENYRNRHPGAPNYTKAQDFYEETFETLGYEVTKDPYGTNAHQDKKLRDSASVASFANVVAFRPGTLVPERIIAFGAHYDTVEQTDEAAWDDLSGTIATLELARAFSTLDTDYSLLFGLWGGEEDGLLGSQFWVRTNPDKVARITSYINLDVFGFAYPGPVEDADPVLVTAGPDGPVSEYLLAKGGEAARQAGIPEDKLLLEPVGQGQASGSVPQGLAGPGAGINAQSDHSSFIAAGVPSYMIGSGDIAAAFGFLHKPKDTIHNLTYYHATGVTVKDGGEQPVMTAEELALGRNLVARSFEHQMFTAFLLEVYAERGEFSPPGRV